MPRGVPSNGPKSNGAKTKRGRLSIITANVGNGMRCWSPVLPGIETEEEWEKLLNDVREHLNPGSPFEERLLYNVALTMQQWNRLHRYDKARISHRMQEVVHDPFAEHGEAAGAAAGVLMERGLSATKEHLTQIERLIEVLDSLPHADQQKPITPEDGRLVLRQAFKLCVKDSGNEQPFEEPPEWTWGAVIGGLSELASDCRKPPSELFESLRDWAIAEAGRLREMLKDGVSVLERCLCHSGTPLSLEYHLKVQTRLMKLLTLYGTVQAARLGLTIVQPPDLELADAQGNGQDDV
jgi:hypothetical protein